MHDVTVTGTNPLAFVASGPIAISGQVTVRAVGRVPGPGAQSSVACNGGDLAQFDCVCAPAACSAGTGGAGNHQIGGRGGTAPTINGGGALTAFSPLAGGCLGGTQRAVNNVTIVARGGAGGGAIQFVSSTRVTFIEQGLIDVGAGGGESTAGGGSGGLVVIEAPEVSLSGPSSGVAANGGAGGGCGLTGSDATATTASAAGAVCANYFGGSGGTGVLAPGRGCLSGTDNCVSACPVVYGGGGGSVGRMRVATKDGTFASSGNPILSVRITAATLTLR